MLKSYQLKRLRESQEIMINKQTTLLTSQEQEAEEVTGNNDEQIDPTTDQQPGTDETKPAVSV